MTVHAAPIPALIDYYRRLRDDPNEDVAAFGFRPQDVSVCILLNQDGGFVDVQNMQQPTKRGPRPISLQLPYYKTRTRAEWPNFLWDHSEYVLGIPVEGDIERAKRRMGMFVQLHKDALDEIGEFAELRALLVFLDNEIDQAASCLCNEEELIGRNIIFKFRGADHLRYFHQVPELQEFWAKRAAQLLEAQKGRSLIDGELDDIAETHPLVRGVSGTNQGKGAVVSFNKDKTAFTSYGKVSNYNAPIGVQDAFSYATALNKLLSENHHRERVGDATVVFWADRKTSDENVFAALFGETEGKDAEDAETVERVARFYQAVRQGTPHAGLENPDAPFYVLGLSPNAARISVRFWLASTVGEFADKLAQHIDNLEIIGARDMDRPLTIRQLIYEGMPEGTAASREKYVAALAGELTRAILTGDRYPQTILSAVIGRIRAGQPLHHPRAAIIKACLIRNYGIKENLVALDKDHPDPAYHMGRLFAAFEKTQQNAMPGLNKTVKDGYFTSASATPSSVFPRLATLHQHHIEKLEGGLKVNRERLIQEIFGHIDGFPSHMPLEKQGLFHIGYYHQRQDFFTKRKPDTDAPASDSEETTND